MNNAGTTAVMPLAATDRAVITRLFDLNVTAPTLLAHAALPYLRDSSGSIVNVSSTYGHRPLAGGAHYAATKSALEQLTRSWALELASEGVRVNAIAPGLTETDVLSAAGLSQDTIDEMRAKERGRIPAGRYGDPKDVADWILRIADPLHTHITGQVLTIDGGLELLTRPHGQHSQVAVHRSNPGPNVDRCPSCHNEGGLTVNLLSEAPGRPPRRKVHTTCYLAWSVRRALPTAGHLARCVSATCRREGTQAFPHCRRRRARPCAATSTEPCGE